jgi:cobalt-zinc-cadmium efflux system membrane fusion protein
VIEAEIILVGKKLDDNRSAEIHCHFAGNTDDLLPGMFVNAEIELQTTGDCVVPEASIVRFGDGEYVFVQSAPEQFIMTKVQTGITDSGFTEIMDPKGMLRDKTIIKKNAWSALMKKENKAEE